MDIELRMKLMQCLKKDALIVQECFMQGCYKYLLWYLYKVTLFNDFYMQKFILYARN